MDNRFRKYIYMNDREGRSYIQKTLNEERQNFDWFSIIIFLEINNNNSRKSEVIFFALWNSKYCFFLNLWVFKVWYGVTASHL